MPGYYMSEGGQSATGALLQHIMTTHPAYPLALKAATEKGITVFDYLNDHLEELQLQTESPSLAYLTRFFHGMLP
jgi:ribulose kinase